MAFRIGRTLPPAAAPIGATDILFGLLALFRGEKAVRNLENELIASYQVRHCVAVSSGRAAIALILQTMHELRPTRDEVLIPAYTCYSVPAAIRRAGLKVRLCDLAAGSLDFDYDLLAQEMENPRLLCVIPTHLFGIPANVARVKGLADSRGVFVLEDAAQAMGGAGNGRMLGTMGDAGIFSLARGKALTTIQGGIILTDDDALGEKLRTKVASLPGCPVYDCLKLFAEAFALMVLIRPWLYWLPKSLPFLNLGETRFDTSFVITKLSPFQAGLGSGWSRKLPRFQANRQANISALAREGLSCGSFVSSATPNLIRLPVLVRDFEVKMEIFEYSERAGLGISPGYPDSIDGIAGLDNLVGAEAFPQAKRVARTLLSLPLHCFVHPRDITRIAALVARSTVTGADDL